MLCQAKENNMCYSRFIPFILFFLLSACATSAAYQQHMLKWQGKNIETLRQQWGNPETAIKLANGHILYQYTRKNFFTIRDPKRSSFHGNNSLFTSYKEPWLSNQTMVRYCRTTFETNRNGNIIDTSFKGNNCLAYGFTR